MPPICINDGPILGLFVLIFITFIPGSFIVVICYAKKNGSGLIVNPNYDNQTNNAELNQRVAQNLGSHSVYGYSPNLVPGQSPQIYEPEQGPPIYVSGEEPPINKISETSSVFNSTTNQTDLNTPDAQNSLDQLDQEKFISKS